MVKRHVWSIILLVAVLAPILLTCAAQPIIAKRTEVPTTEIGLAKGNKVYVISYYVCDNDTAWIDSEHLSCVTDGINSHFPVTDTGYSITVLSTENRELFKANLGISFRICWDGTNEKGELIGGSEFVEGCLFKASGVPYFENMNKIVVMHPICQAETN